MLLNKSIYCLTPVLKALIIQRLLALTSNNYSFGAFSAFSFDPAACGACFGASFSTMRCLRGSFDALGAAVAAGAALGAVVGALGLAAGAAAAAGRSVLTATLAA
ncbi:hypothetical protein N9O85_02755, partial [Porticoccaceae bacterium]|nr:hypothetical protein [Porticoccaceae bacterium]